MRSRPSFFLGYLFTYKLTPAGRTLIFVVLLSAIGSITVELPIYQIFCSLVSLMFCLEAMGILMQPRLAVDVHLPATATAGDVLQGYVNVTNKGRWPAFDVMCSLYGLPRGLTHLSAHEMCVAIPSGGTASIPVAIGTSERGVFALPPLRPHSTFPLNIMRFGRQPFAMPVITVLPSFHPLEQLELPVSLRYQPGGVFIEGHVGASPEFIGNREYTYGEPVRRLDFRAWARLGKPVVREFQEEYCTRVALILDTFQPSVWRGKQRNHLAFEQAVSMTAAIADGLSGSESIIDLFAAGPELYVFRAVTGSTHFDKVLEILGGIEPTRGDPFEKLSPVVSEELESISAVLCVFLDWDEHRERFVQHVAEAGCEPYVILVRDDRPTTMWFPEDGRHYRHLTPEMIHEGEVEVL